MVTKISSSKTRRGAFGSCARVQEHPRQPVWQAVAQGRPVLFFWLGDNVYGDSLHGEILANEYRRQRHVAELQPLLRSVPQLAIWDDHDFGLNDHDRTNPIKETALEVRIRPVYAGGPNFGVLDFDLESEPTLRFTVSDFSGQRVWEPFVLKARELVNGVSSWQEKKVS